MKKPAFKIDRRRLGAAHWNTYHAAGTAHDRALVRQYCLLNPGPVNRAVKMLIADWRNGVIKTPTRVRTDTGLPNGWSERNLSRRAPNEFALIAHANLLLTMAGRPESEHVSEYNSLASRVRRAA